MASRPNAETTADMARTRLLVAALSVAALVAGSAPGYPSSKAPSRAKALPGTPTFVISGRGWGHGVGMAQWGTLGFARNGWAYDRILRHYYRGTTLVQQPARTVRVLLVEQAKRVVLSSESPWSVTDATGAKVVLEPGRVVLGPGLVVAGKRLASPLVFAPGATPLLVAGKPYRERLTVQGDGKTLSVVNVLGLEAYLKGVVPREVPSTWPAEALKVQAVAARSFALANLLPASATRAFDLYSDQRSQVYGGIEAEASSVSAAVDATAGRVVTHGGKVVATLYSASSGGRTSSAAETFGRPVPYLVSVADPYDTLSP
jgi:stage II sporulation protein D